MAGKGGGGGGGMAGGRGPGAGGAQGTGGGMRDPHTGRKRFFVPPGGFAGFSQQSPATQALLRGAGGRTVRSPGRRKKKKRTAQRGAPRKRKSSARTRSGRARLVKGSAAAKRYMAKIRKLRKRK